MNKFRKIIETGNKIYWEQLLKKMELLLIQEMIHLSEHFPDGQPIKPTTYSNNTVRSEDIIKWKPHWITTEKLGEVFKLFKTKSHLELTKSYGSKKTVAGFLKHIVFLYKCLIKLNFTNTRWKESKMVFTRKGILHQHYIQDNMDSEMIGALKQRCQTW